jgi:hypothetical protein
MFVEVGALTVCTDKEGRLMCMPVLGMSSPGHAQAGHVFLAKVEHATEQLGRMLIVGVLLM